MKRICPFILALGFGSVVFGAIPAAPNFNTNNFKVVGPSVALQATQNLSGLNLTNMGLTITRPAGQTSYVWASQMTIDKLIVDVRNFGAVADDATDNSAAFQAAMTQAGYGGSIYIPAGVWRGHMVVTNGISIVGAGAGIQGGIDGNTVLRAFDKTRDVIQVGNSNILTRNVNISRIQFDGRMANYDLSPDTNHTASIAVGLREGAEMITIRECIFQRFNTADIYAQATLDFDLPVDRVLVDTCELYLWAWGDSIKLYQRDPSFLTAFNINNCNLRGRSETTAGFLLVVDGKIRPWIRNTWFDTVGNLHGVDAYGPLATIDGDNTFILDSPVSTNIVARTDQTGTIPLFLRSFRGAKPIQLGANVIYPQGLWESKSDYYTSYYYTALSGYRFSDNGDTPTYDPVTDTYPNLNDILIRRAAGDLYLENSAGNVQVFPEASHTFRVQGTATVDGFATLSSGLGIPNDTFLRLKDHFGNYQPVMELTVSDNLLVQGANDAGNSMAFLTRNPTGNIAFQLNGFSGLLGTTAWQIDPAGNLSYNKLYVYDLLNARSNIIGDQQIIATNALGYYIKKADGSPVQTLFLTAGDNLALYAPSTASTLAINNQNASGTVDIQVGNSTKISQSATGTTINQQTAITGGGNLALDLKTSSGSPYHLKFTRTDSGAANNLTLTGNDLYNEHGISSAGYTVRAGGTGYVDNNWTPSTLMEANGGNSLVSIANGTGYLKNNGAGAFSWDAGTGSGGTVGTLINTTATTAGQLVKFTDTTKTNTAPASAVDISSAIGNGGISNANLANSSVTVNGTANQVTVTGSPLSLGGTLTLAGPQDLATTSSPTFDNETITTKESIGSGDAISYLTTSTAQHLSVRKGTAASPDTDPNAVVKVERLIEIPAASISGDGLDNLAAIMGIAKGTAINQVQPIGVFGAGITSSTNNTGGGAGNDAAGVVGAARAIDSANGIAIGGYFASRRETSTGLGNAVQIAMANYTSSFESYSPTTFPKTAGIWMVAAGTTNSTVGINLGNAFGPQFDVGLAFDGRLNGGQLGPAKTASIQDDGGAVTSVKINGTHTTGIDLSGATISGNAITLAAGQTLSGGILSPSSALAIAKGGTGAASASTAFDALAPTTLRGDIIVRDASSNTRLAVGTVTSRMMSDGTDPLWAEPQNMVLLYDENLLNSSGIFNWTTSVSGSGAAWTTTTSPAGRPGVQEFQTGTTTNAITGKRVSSTSMLFGNGRTIYKTAVRIPTLSDGTETFNVFLGWNDNGGAVGDAVDGAYFLYSSSGTYYTTGGSVGKWVGRTANNSARSETAASASVVAGQWYTLMIDVNAAGSQADFYVDGTLLGSLNTNIPTAAGRETGLAIKVEKSLGNTSRNLDEDFVMWYYKPTTPR